MNNSHRQSPRLLRSISFPLNNLASLRPFGPYSPCYSLGDAMYREPSRPPGSPGHKRHPHHLIRLDPSPESAFICVHLRLNPSESTPRRTVEAEWRIFTQHAPLKTFRSHKINHLEMMFLHNKKSLNMRHPMYLSRRARSAWSGSIQRACAGLPGLSHSPPASIPWRPCAMNNSHRRSGAVAH